MINLSAITVEESFMTASDNTFILDRDSPSVPVEFARLILLMAGERGYQREVILDGLNIPTTLIDEEGASLSVDQHESLLLRMIELSNHEGGLGYELGLRIGLTTHSLMAYALLSQVTLGDAIRFGIEFSQVFVPVYRGKLLEEDGYAVIDISMDMSLEDRLYRYAYDLALTSVWSGLCNLMGSAWHEVELWFNYPEPEYYANYKDRLPTCRFDMGANQVCFPIAQLAKRIHTGDAVMAQLMTEKIKRERDARHQQGRADIVSLVRQRLICGQQGYPDLEMISTQLFMSTRTLKRKLQQANTSFQLLLDESRLKDAIRMLSSSSRSIEDIATWMGYAEPANFTHAFRKWTGMTPSLWRENHKNSPSSS